MALGASVSWKQIMATAAACAVALWIAATVSVRAQAYDDQAWRIAQELQCPICQGQSVAESNSQLATQMRALIREKLAAGESREAILQYFVDRYGETVLMSPPRRGFSAFAWVTPYIGVLATVGFLIWVVRRRSTHESGDAEDSAQLDPYLAEVDQTFDRLRDEPLR
jgi:cytochrome c-type biogenesis protein CcmH